MKRIRDRDRMVALCSHRRRRQLKRMHALKGQSERHLLRLRGPAPTGRRFRAPSDFSLLTNPEATLAHFNAVADELGHRGSAVHEIQDIDALDVGTVLLLMDQFKTARTTRVPVWTTVPAKAEPKQTLSETEIGGYARWLTPDGKPPAKPRPGHRRRVHSNSSQIVEPESAAEMVAFAKSCLAVDTHTSSTRAAYRTTIEAMSNTRNHTGTGTTKNSVPWIMCAIRLDGDRVGFAFLDRGPGILETVHRNYGAFIRDFFQGSPEPHDLLREIVAGDTILRRVKSSTRLQNRGHGLPGMRDDSAAGRIRRLHILANNAFADVDADQYRKLPGFGLQGTFLYWELWPETSSEPNNGEKA